MDSHYENMPYSIYRDVRERGELFVEQIEVSVVVFDQDSFMEEFLPVFDTLLRYENLKKLTVKPYDVYSDGYELIRSGSCVIRARTVP